MTGRIKEKTAHIRKLLKLRGIRARVRMCPTGGSIQVITPEYGVKFSSEEIWTIARIAKDNGLTKAQRTPICIDLETQLTEANQFSYEYHADLDREMALIAEGE